MKVAVIYNKTKDVEGVINVFGMQNQETYNPKTVERVASALEKGSHNVRIIDGNINVIEQLQNFMPRVVQGEQPGMVFNMAYGLQGVSRYTHIPSLLEMLGIPYVGSSPAGHGIALDKVTTKVMIQAAGLPTARYWVFYSPDQIPDGLPYPVITKPKMEAVSMGIEIIQNKKDLEQAIGRLVEDFKQPVLVEDFIPGREFAVGLLGNRDPEVLPIVEIDLQGDPHAIQSLTDKLKQPKGKICPAQIDEKLAGEMRRLTKETFRVLGIYDFCRVDYRMDKDGNLYILELNSMASLGLTGSYVHSAQVAGYTYESMINRMLDVAVERYFGSKEIEQVAIEETTPKSKSLPLTVRLRSYLRGHVATMEEDLARMVEINSFVRNIEGVNSFGRWISNKLGELGFQRQVFPRAEFGNNLYFTNHLDDTNDVLLIGHLDNPVHFQDFTPFVEERGRIYGTGISRGKGGLGVMLGALKALRFTRSLKKVRCGIVLITDESLGGRSSHQLIEDVSKKSKYVFGLRGAGLAGELITSCSGSLRFNVEINYTPGKARTKIDSKPIDPVSYVAEKVLVLQKMGANEEGVSVIVTSLQTKIGEDMPPDYASLGILIRYRDPKQRKIFEQQIYRIFEENSHRPVKVHITKGPQKQPLLESEIDDQLFKNIENLAKKLEVRVKKAHSDISSSLSYVPNEIPALDGFGPVTGGFGTSNEYVVRDSLIDRAVLLSYVIFKTSKNIS